MEIINMANTIIERVTAFMNQPADENTYMFLIGAEALIAVFSLIGLLALRDWFDGEEVEE